MSTESQSVCMAFDALRILMGGKPKRYSAADIAAMFSELARRGIGCVEQSKAAGK